MRSSSNRYWRTLSHEVPRNRSADLAELRRVRFASSSRPPAERWAGLTAIWIASTCAGWPTGVCASTRSTCCTLSAGGQASMAPATFWNGISPNRRCWSISASSPVYSRGLPVPPSTRASPSPIAPSVMSSPTLLARLPEDSIKLICAAANGLGQTALGNQPAPGQRTQAEHRAAIDR